MVQAVLCVGLAKLLLAGLADDPNVRRVPSRSSPSPTELIPICMAPQVLKSLLLAYVSPYTTGNAELRQCLSYFFSVYFYATAANQGRLRSVCRLLGFAGWRVYSSHCDRKDLHARVRRDDAHARRAGRGPDDGQPAAVWALRR